MEEVLRERSARVYPAIKARVHLSIIVDADLQGLMPVTVTRIWLQGTPKLSPDVCEAARQSRRTSQHALG